MTISDLIDQLEKLEAEHGDLNVEIDSGVEVSDVDAIYIDGNCVSKPIAVVIK